MLQGGSVVLDPKFQVEGVAPTKHSSPQKTRLNNLSYGIKIWKDLSSVLSQCTHLTDRRTDTFLVASPRWHANICFIDSDLLLSAGAKKYPSRRRRHEKALSHLNLSSIN